MSKILAIGDIHGQYNKLLNLLAQAWGEFNFDKDTTVFLGDYVDGGPKTKDVIDLIMEMQRDNPNVVALMGNHEDLMLSGLSYRESVCAPYVQSGDYYLWYNQGGKATLDSYRAHVTDEYQRSIMQSREIIGETHLKWMNYLPLHFETDKYIFVHAGLRPYKTVEETSDFDKLWIRWDFIDDDYDWGKRVIFGHTVQKSLEVWDQPNKLGIDTMHHGHGNITAVILDDADPTYVKFLQSED